MFLVSALRFRHTSDDSVLFRERFDNPAEYESVKDLYIIDNDLMAKAKPTTIVMHPMPRNNELDEALDFDVKRAAYFRQMRYGLYVSFPLAFLRNVNAYKMLLPFPRSEWLS
jgi:aspartate carbamoyltransferase catalytic subunit